MRARAGKDLYCVSRETNADDGSTIFKFSEEVRKSSHIFLVRMALTLSSLIRIN